MHIRPVFSVLSAKETNNPKAQISEEQLEVQKKEGVNFLCQSKKVTKPKTSKEVRHNSPLSRLLKSLSVTVLKHLFYLCIFISEIQH